MNAGSLPQIGLRTAKTFEDLNSGFSLRVVGDGRVEQALTDRFGSAQNLESVEDRRLREFARREQAIASAQPAPSKEEASAQLTQAAHETLGTEWQLNELESGADPVNRVVFKHSQNGVDQTVDIENRQNPSGLTLGTDARIGGWDVQHRIEVALKPGTGIDPSTATESAYFQA